MKDKIRLPVELGEAVKLERKRSKLKATDIAIRSGRARNVLYRLERGDGVTVGSLTDILRAMKDIQSDRKYQGSDQRIAERLRYLQLDSESLARFFEQVAFSVMVRNGDGHLKNFGVLYSGLDDVRLAPMFDVVTTSIYRYTRYEGGPELEDRTLALKLFSGKHHTRAYPTTEELLRFGSTVCGVARPALAIERIADAMDRALQDAAGDDRIPDSLLGAMAQAWADGMAHATSRSAGRR